ncbi:hypothetical protein SGPA1_51057 [Streptomyces misionensis JCM 4497]
MVGRGHCLRERLQEVRLLVQQLHDRVASAVPRARGDDLLARREEVAVRLQPAQVLLGLRGRRDDRGRPAALHGRGDRPAVHRHARSLHRRVRLRPHARLQPAAPAEERRLRAAVPAGGRSGRDVAAPGAGAVDQDDRLGPDPPAVRPDREVHHRPAPGHRRGRAGPAALHPRRTKAPHLPGDRGTRAGNTYGVHLRLPRRRGPAPRDQRRAPGRGELELRQPRPFLRQGRRLDRLRQGVPGSLDAGAAPAAVRIGVRQHPAPPGHPERGEVAEPAHRRRPAGPVPAVLDPRQPLRPVRTRHELPPRPRHPGGHGVRLSYGCLILFRGASPARATGAVHVRVIRGRRRIPSVVVRSQPVRPLQGRPR